MGCCVETVFPLGDKAWNDFWCDEGVAGFPPESRSVISHFFLT